MNEQSCLEYILLWREDNRLRNVKYFVATSQKGEWINYFVHKNSGGRLTSKITVHHLQNTILWTHQTICSRYWMQYITSNFTANLPRYWKTSLTLQATFWSLITSFYCLSYDLTPRKLRVMYILFPLPHAVILTTTAMNLVKPRINSWFKLIWSPWVSRDTLNTI